ncbi:sulfatase-like hydrolase/transferase [Persicobacter psychrovividus]|uniref:Sulfatase N-terminal domain-containing protein n=1 Tax=Persicobacter psychrovividus TaxID=387638 RepID=A0ABM7VLY4_9BACT|nr:hypothetical protein PEPS_42890 [Persicobacter psychrovividus]
MINNLLNKIFISLSLLIMCGTLTAKNRKLPNIIVFIADDAGMDLGAYGNPHIKTPNLDQMAADGILMKKAFLTTAQCSPSRTSLLSGKFAHTIGTEDLHAPLPEAVKLLPSYLNEMGYFTSLLMKSHLGTNGDQQFDYRGPGHDVNAFWIYRSY